MVNEVMSDPVLSALPEEDARGVGVDFSNMVDVVVNDEVLVAGVFCTGAVAGD